jgi:sugar transferase (PEP-CTERM/EpsH1 system associated)
MPDLLFLSHRIPFPPDKGDKIRAFRILEHLAARYRIHLGCFVDDDADWVHRAALQTLCAEVACFRLPAATARLRAARGFVTGAPLSLAMFRHPDMKAWVQRTLSSITPAIVFGFSSAMGQYIIDAHLKPSTRVIMDFVDVDSDKWRQYADDAAPPMSWVYRRESQCLLAFDRRLAARADGALFVSAPEAQLFRDLAPEVGAKTHAVANGIDSAYFSPDHAFPTPFSGPGPHLVFTGTMDYRPNVDAVVWFVSEILPLIRRRQPDAVFAIVGAKPAPGVLKLAEPGSVIVTGRVADVRPYVQHADVVVAPLRLARGVQNKVLEGMAMARPVVTTPQGLEGIDARDGVELLVATTPEAFAEAVYRAVQTHGIRLGTAARELMLKAYAWPSQLAILDRLMQG